MAVSCAVSERVFSGGGLRAIGACEANGGTEILDARGAVVGGNRVACGLHDGAGSVVAFLVEVACACRDGLSASGLRRVVELLSVGFSGDLVVRCIRVSQVEVSRFVSVVVVVVAVLRFAPALESDLFS